MAFADSAPSRFEPPSHTAAEVAALRHDDFADVQGMRAPIIDQADVDYIGHLTGVHWLTDEVKRHVLELCRRKRLDPPVAWLSAADARMTPARRTALLSTTAMGRQVLRDAALKDG